VPTLRELQTGFGAAVLGDDESVAAALVRGDGLSASARLGVYRHHIFMSLTAALESTYPVVARLVDPRFFRYAAHEYIRDNPPAGPCRFEPSRHLAYLPDVARLEWAMNVALNAPEATPIDPDALRSQGAVALHPSVTLLTSPWPVDALWRANQPNAPEPAVDLQAGDVRLRVWRVGDEVVFRALSTAGFAFHDTLARTHHLADAADAALSADPAADLAELLREMLDAEVLV
jgi:hypothetical protein